MLESSIGPAAISVRPVALRFRLRVRDGRDGIHGATMASDSFDDASENKRPNVQVGDPFLEKLLLEACLEFLEQDLLLRFPVQSQCSRNEFSLDPLDQ